MPAAACRTAPEAAEGPELEEPTAPFTAAAAIFRDAANRRPSLLPRRLQTLARRKCGREVEPKTGGVAMAACLRPPRIRQTARPPAGGRGDAPSGAPPRLGAIRRVGLSRERRKEPPRSSPRPQSLRRAAAAPAAATAGRRGRRSGRRDELVGRRGKKVLRLFRCRWEPEARGPFGEALPGEEAALGNRRLLPHRLGSLLPPCLHVVPQAPPFRTSPQEPQTRLPRRLDPKTSGARPSPELPRIQGHFSGVWETGSLSDLRQLPYSRPPTSGTRSRPSRVFPWDTEKPPARASLPSSARASTSPSPQALLPFHGRPPPQPL